MWTQWNGPAARNDLSRASELGVNAVRMLVPYKPENGWTDKDTGQVDPVYLNELQQFVQMAGDLQLKVIIALFDFYDPINDPLPPDPGRRSQPPLSARHHPRLRQRRPCPRLGPPQRA